MLEAITRIEEWASAKERTRVKGRTQLGSEGECVRFGRTRYPVLGGLLWSGLGAREEQEDVDVVRLQTNRSVMARWV